MGKFSERSRSFNTFDPHHISSAAAGAALDILSEELLLQNAERTGGDCMLAARRAMLPVVQHCA